jgi:hypothetical protein
MSTDAVKLFTFKVNSDIVHGVVTETRTGDRVTVLYGAVFALDYYIEKETKKVRILVACEESQAVTMALREQGHEAYSCDIQECSGGHPEWHIQGDAIKAIDDGEWDQVISFPPCTDISVSGARWFEAKRADGRQEASIRFFFEIWKRSDVVENPIGVLNKPDYVRKWFPELYEEMKAAGFPFDTPQIIQPYHHGHLESKATCLWLPTGLGELKKTDDRTEEFMKLPKSETHKVHRCPPGPERGKIRSRTYPGIAKAIATQWAGRMGRTAKEPDNSRS